MSENLRDRYAEVMDKHRPVQSPRLVVDCLCGWMADKRRPDHFTEHLTSELMAVRDDVLAEKDAEIERLRATSTRLNRRATDAEAVAVQNIEQLERKGATLGRGLANAGYGIAIRRAEAAEAEVARLREEKQRLGAAVIDLCWKATQYGQTEDGDTFAYLFPKGTVHRLIGAAQGVGVRAAFRMQADDALERAIEADLQISAELARLREAMGRVEALIEPGRTPDGEPLPEWVAVDDLRAAMAPRESATEAPRTRDGEQGGEPEAKPDACPHAAPFRYCGGCQVSPCPIGLDS